jgi:hypothetical protein
MATWDIVLTNKAGDVTGVLDAPAGLKYTRRESDYNQLELGTLNSHDLNLIALHPYKTKLQAWRNNDLVFWGDIVDPITVTQSGAQVIAKDAFARLDAPTRTKYTFNDKTLKHIAETVIGGETTYGARDIAFGSETVTEIFDRQITKGQRMGEFIKTCCTVSPTGGSYFRCDALDDPDNPVAMHFGDGGDRTDNTGARWEYGTGTIDNVSEFVVEARGLVNRVYVYNNNQSVVVEDTDSIDEYGLVEKWYRRPGVNHIATLTALAYSKLQPSPFTVVSFVPTADGPKLFDDFDVGDKCRAYFQLDGESMVYSASNMIPVTVELTIDESGVENVNFSEGQLVAKGQNSPYNPDRYDKPRVEAVATFALTAT